MSDDSTKTEKTPKGEDSAVSREAAVQTIITKAPTDAGLSYVHVVSGIIDSSLCVAARFDRNGACLFASARCKDAFGVAAHEMLGRALGDIVGGFDSLRQDSESCSCWQALTTALADGTRTECTFTVRVEGTPKTYLAMISPERLGSESSEYADVVFVDISQCLDRFHSLKHASINKERFMGIVAHELRNPLSAIASGLKILAVSPSGADTLQVREMMERQVVQLSRLVHDLLDMSRINEAKLTLTKSRGLLREILSLAIDTAQGSIKKGKHELRVHVPDEPIELCVDSSRIAQVISNLLDNSSKYTAPGGVIILQVVHSPKELVISVRDNGVGIAPENRERIFQQFMQVDRERRRSRGGLGLGLYLVKMIVEAHGGSIEAASNGEGHGSEFVVRLPV